MKSQKGHIVGEIAAVVAFMFIWFLLSCTSVSVVYCLLIEPNDVVRALKTIGYKEVGISKEANKEWLRGRVTFSVRGRNPSSGLLEEITIITKYLADPVILVKNL